MQFGLTNLCLWERMYQPTNAMDGAQEDRVTMTYNATILIPVRVLNTEGSASVLVKVIIKFVKFDIL